MLYFTLEITHKYMHEQKFNDFKNAIFKYNL